MSSRSSLSDMAFISVGLPREECVHDQPTKHALSGRLRRRARLVLTYALVGLGGAVGSILRAWIGTLMVALTGPDFPWGTILINVTGSFAIGFFGTLTASDGRLVVAPDMRAFVMVGICGGFTTFSSFSLQTLELLRDGRPGEALGNIALSVLLCLGSVTAGYSAALLVRTAGPVVLRAAGPEALGSQILVAVYRPEMVRPMLGQAAGLMTRQDGRITVLAIDGPVLADLLPTEDVMTQERRDELSRRRRDWVGSVRPALDRWVAAEHAQRHQARWIEVRGDGTRAIIEHGREAHLLLLEHRLDDRASLDRIHTALVRAGLPLLLVPPDATGGIGRVVAVAWRDDVQAAQAVRAAMPILSRAERIIVVHVSALAEPTATVPDVLRALPTELRWVRDSGDDVGSQLLELTRKAKADLLVIGSYGRGRLLEALFDGVTEHVLKSAQIPILIQPRGLTGATTGS